MVLRDVVVPPDDPVPAARGEKGRVQGGHGSDFELPRPVGDQQQARVHHPLE